MMDLDLENVARVTGGRLLRGNPRTGVRRVATDTRTLVPGDLFFALRGERYDGHEFVAQAAARGAVGVVVHTPPANLPQTVALIEVADTLAALQSLARYNRERSGVRLIAVTGSTGKTTTKDLTAAVLAARYRVLATRGNLNNEIGVPLTLLELEAHHQVAVCELAMRGPGEIDALCRLVLPNAGVITNIGETHLELLGSVASIAQAKGELLEHIPPDGFAVLHLDSPYMRAQARRCRGRVIFFGEEEGADIRLLAYHPADAGAVFEACVHGREMRFTLPVPGRHNAVNALAAVGVGLEMGLDPAAIARGLLTARLSPMRLNIQRCGSLTVIDDAYNASPASVQAALDVLQEVGRDSDRVAVLGNMLELGVRAREGHREVGAACAAAGLKLLVTVGELAQEIAHGAQEAGMPASAVHACADNPEAIQLLARLLTGREVVLVKGSRGARMEEIVAALRATGEGTAP
ncbi:MAG: UDP-N-acetylmuramoyl-tripeptide--D-alanyl-D-alanine ligase [Bacillota bacterium]